MALPYPVPTPRPIPYDIGLGTGFEVGWAPWSGQRMINRFHHSWDDVAPEETPMLPALVDEDYRWGNAETEATKRIQHLLHLDEDGVLGPATQKRAIKYFTGDMPVSWKLPPAYVYRERYGKLPRNLLHSISAGESAYLLCNTSWNGVQGDDDFSVDFGAFQDNIEGSGLESEDALQHGMDVRFQAQKKADELIRWVGENGMRRGCAPEGKFDPERAYRRACMAHNRPLDAACLARFPLDELDSQACEEFEKEWVGIPGYRPQPWNEPLAWVLARGCSFPGTTVRVETRLQWDRFYALGYGHPDKPGYWRGLVCRWVTAWTPQA